MTETDRLVMIADLLDKGGLYEEADRLDKSIKKAAEESKDEESITEDPKDEESTTEDTEEISVEDGEAEADVENELKELKKEKQVFIKLFYRDLFKINQKLQKILDSEQYNYIGKDNVDILKNLYSSLMKIMKKELNSIGIEEETLQVASLKGLKKLALSKDKVLKDVKQIFLPTIKMYEEFEDWLVDHSDFASGLVQTKKTFQNLKNVISNIVENVSEAITGIELLT